VSAPKPKAWENYEQVVNYLLERFSETFGLGLERVEGKQKLVGDSEMEWTIDGKGVKTDDGGIIVIESRRYTTSKVKPGAMGELAYRVRDLGAAGGIIVTPIGVQEGGVKIAKKEGIEIFHLDKDSTPTDFMLEGLKKVVAGRSANFGGTGTLTVEARAVVPNGSES
jgi:hypothetical protein